MTGVHKKEWNAAGTEEIEALVVEVVLPDALNLTVGSISLRRDSLARVRVPGVQGDGGAQRAVRRHICGQLSVFISGREESLMRDGMKCTNFCVS